ANVIFRRPNEEEINDYLNHEITYDCAGSLKSESLESGLLMQYITQIQQPLLVYHLFNSVKCLEVKNIKHIK
nr:Maf family protein [Gammaproteobacteria bacterium]